MLEVGSLAFGTIGAWSLLSICKSIYLDLLSDVATS